MHHPILFLVGAFLVARLVMRRMRWRRLAFAGHGHCGRRLRGPIDLGAPDADDGERLSKWERRAARWQARMQARMNDRLDRFNARAQQPAAPAKIDFAAALELNPRQRTLFDDVVVKASSHAREALSLVAAEPFDRGAAEDLVGPGDLADDLLQLHHSLTPEQRGKLRGLAN